MDNATRLLYLEAMGITAWQPIASNAQPSTLAAHTDEDAQPESAESNSAVATYIESDHGYDPHPASTEVRDATVSYSAVEQLDWDTLQARVAA
ncbi:MAG: hypothetical protein LUQ57_00490, partial [Methylococcaceae bacterium]|nr:hypothetical protein [Methylococcaceae bacterium]